MRKCIFIFLMLCSVCWPATIKFGVIADVHVEDVPEAGQSFGDAPGYRLPGNQTASVTAFNTNCDAASVDFAISVGDMVDAAASDALRYVHYGLYVDLFDGTTSSQTAPVYFAIGHWDYGGPTGNATDWNNIFDNTNGIGTIIPTGGDVPVNVWWPTDPAVTAMNPCAYTFDNSGFTIIVLCNPSIQVNMDEAGKLGGTHTAAGAHATIVTDSAADYPVDGLIGYTLVNTTDSSTGTVTDNDGTTITVDDLTGGTDDQFEQNDTYTVALTQNQWFGGRLTVAEAAAQPTIVFSHHSLKGGEGNPPAGTPTAITAMEAQTIKPIVFGGHRHFDDAIIELNGIVYINLRGDAWGWTETDTTRFSHAIATITGPTYTDVNGQRCLIKLEGFGYQKSKNSPILVGYWKLDEINGTAAAGDAIVDSSGNAYHGTNSETVVSVSSPVGHGLSVDGTGDYINATDKPILDFPLTLSVWFRQSSNASGTILSLSDESHAKYQEIYIVSGLPGLKAKGGITEQTEPRKTTGAITSKVWHLITGVFTAANDRDLYIDGKFLKTSTANSIDFDALIDEWTIGARAGGGTFAELVTGDISDARIYSGALSANDIKALYRAGTISSRRRGSQKVKTTHSRTRGRNN